MCGIILAILEAHQDVNDIEGFNEVVKLIEQRGPEYKSDIVIADIIDSSHKLAFKVSVLSFQSENVQQQPIVDSSTGNVFLFNGQVFSYMIDNDKELSRFDKSDTLFLSDKLNECTTDEQILDVISKIKGPYAFIYWKSNINSIYFGRDVFGRRSLCVGIEKDSEKTVMISSVGPNEICKSISWTEVGAHSLYKLDLSQDTTDIESFPWNLHSIFESTQMEHAQKTQFEIKVPLKVPLNTRLDCSEEIVYHQIVAKFKDVIITSLKRRTLNQRRACLVCRLKDRVDLCTHPKISVAFSGGVDSTVLALLLDEIEEKGQPIDLLNVAFTDRAPDRLSAFDAYSELIKLAPKRPWNLVCCDINIDELQERRRQEAKHLISPLSTVIDDSLGCALFFAARGKGRLITAEDMKNAQNIVCFEPRSSTSCDSNHQSYTSQASILIVGMGIDEQLGGYSSHKAAYRAQGDLGLVSEISRQMKQISSRNLGRDDRVSSCFGRDMRIPFLDEDLVDFLNELPVSLKMDLSSANNALGPKKLLRTLALSLGLELSARQVKRAMQFGTRIAKLESHGEKGCDKCDRL